MRWTGRVGLLGSFALAIVASAGVTASRAAAQSGEWLVAQVGAEGAPHAARRVRAALQGHRVRMIDAARLRSRLAERGVAEVASAPLDLREALARAAETTLEEVARGDDDQVVATARSVLGQARPHIASLGRDDAAAADVGNLCLYAVRAHLHARRADDARTQALECLGLVPDLDPSTRLHPPNVRALVDAERQSLEAASTHVLVARVASVIGLDGCRVRVNGRALGAEVRRAMVPGTYYVDGVCGAREARFAKTVDLSSPSAVRVEITPLEVLLRLEADEAVLDDADPAAIEAAVSSLASTAQAAHVVTVSSSMNETIATRYDAASDGSLRRVGEARWRDDDEAAAGEAIALLTGTASPEAPSRATPGGSERDGGRPIVGPLVLGVAGLGALTVVGVGLAGEGCLREESGRCVEERSLSTTAAIVYGGAGVAAIAGALLWHLLGGDASAEQPVAVTRHGIELRGAF